MKKIFYFCLIILFLVVGCGGGGDGASPGGGNVPITNTRTYFLDDDGYYEPGYRLQFNLSGSSNIRIAGNIRDIFIGTFSVQTQNKVVVGGEILIPVETLLNLTNNTSGASLTAFSTIYYDQNNQNVFRINETEGVTCTPVDGGNKPAIARIGDFGRTISWNCDDGDTLTGTWILEPGPGTLANYTTNEILKDASGATVGTERFTTTLDESGDPKSLRSEMYFFSLGGVTLTLTGTRVIK